VDPEDDVPVKRFSEILGRTFMVKEGRGIIILVAINFLPTDEEIEKPYHFESPTPTPSPHSDTVPPTPPQTHNQQTPILINPQVVEDDAMLGDVLQQFKHGQGHLALVRGVEEFDDGRDNE